MKRIISIVMLALLVFNVCSLSALAEIPAYWNDDYDEWLKNNSPSPAPAPTTTIPEDTVAYRFTDSAEDVETVSLDNPVLEGMDSVEEFDVDAIVNNMAAIDADGISRIGYYSKIDVFAIILSNNSGTLKVYEDFTKEEYTKLLSAANPYAFYWNKVSGKYNCKDYAILPGKADQQAKASNITAPSATPVPTSKPAPESASKPSSDTPDLTESEAKTRAAKALKDELSSKSFTYDLSKTSYMISDAKYNSVGDAWYVTGTVTVYYRDGMGSTNGSFKVVVKDWSSSDFSYVDSINV